MTQEEKSILLKDLCARLPYGVKVTWDGLYSFTLTPSIYVELWEEERDHNIPKVYLRPMSSMTGEEKNEWADLFNLELDKLNDIEDEEKAEELAPIYFGNSHCISIDWLNAHHFDYRGLIEKDLALEALEGMYK